MDLAERSIPKYSSLFFFFGGQHCTLRCTQDQWEGKFLEGLVVTHATPSRQNYRTNRNSSVHFWNHKITKNQNFLFSFYNVSLIILKKKIFCYINTYGVIIFSSTKQYLTVKIVLTFSQKSLQYFTKYLYWWWVQ